MHEAVVRAVHGFKGGMAAAAAAGRDAAARAAKGLARDEDVMSVKEVVAYLNMVMFPRQSEEDVFCARPGFVMMYDLTPLKRAAPTTKKPPASKFEGDNGRVKVDRGPSASASGASTDGGDRSAAPAPSGAVTAPRATATSGATISPHMEKLELALQETMDSALLAEEAQSKLEALLAKEQKLQSELAATKVPQVKLDFSDMPSFELDAEAREYKGDPDDRREILAHRKRIEKESDRLAVAKEKWIAGRRKEAKQAAKVQANATRNVKLSALRGEIAQAKKAVQQTFSVATSHAKKLERLRSRATAAQQHEAELASRKREAEAYRAQQQQERAAKKSKIQLEREAQKLQDAERKLKEAEQRAKVRAEAARYPMDDNELVAYDAAQAKEQNRDPWPAVANGTAWKPSAVDVSQMQICEFFSTFGRILTPSVDEFGVEYLNTILDDSDLTKLSKLYVSLLRVAVTTTTYGIEALVKTWSDALEFSGTFPEIMKQFAKEKSRVGQIDAVTLSTINALTEKRIGMFTPEEHTRVLDWLCGECFEAPEVNKEVNRRVKALEDLSKEKESDKAIENAFEKEYKKLAPQLRDANALVKNASDELIQKVQAHEALITLPQSDVEVPTELQSDVRAFLEARSLLKETEAKKNEIAAQAAKRRRQFQEERIRSNCLGQDRNGTKYYWNLSYSSGALLAIHVDGTWSKLTTEQQLREWSKSLNTKGIREHRLHKNVAEIRAELVAAFRQAELEAMNAFPKSSQRTKVERWNEIAARETLSMEGAKRIIQLLMADVVNCEVSAPDGTMSGWRIWGRELEKTTELTEMIRYLMQIEEAMVEMCDLPRDVTAKDANGSAINASNERLMASHEWWELIIPSDEKKAGKRLWRTNQERAIWQEAMSTCDTYARIAYGAAMLESYSRPLFEFLENIKKRAKRESSRFADYTSYDDGYDSYGQRT